MIYKKIQITIVALLITFQLYASNQALALIDQMIERNNQVKTLSFRAYMSERIKGDMIDKNSYFKIQLQPRKIYIKQSFIGIDLESLYIEGENNNQLLVTTIGFPWITANLDPFGSTVRDKHHHTIKEAGFEYFVSIIKHLKNSTNPSFESMCSYQGTVVREKNVCYKITIDNTNFTYVEYIVKPGENLTTIANKLKLNDYMILEKNPKIKNFTDVIPGQKIWVPNIYAKKLILYLDSKLMLPVGIEIFDDQGKYAEYDYLELKLNPAFKPNEFSKDNPEYTF